MTDPFSHLDPEEAAYARAALEGEQDGAGASSSPGFDRGRVVRAIIAGVIAAPAAAIAVWLVRSRVTVPLLCERDGGTVESVTVSNGSIDGDPTSCTFTDGTTIELADIVGTPFAFAEFGLSIVAMLVLLAMLWAAIARLIAR